MEIKHENLILQSNEEETYFLIVGCEEDAEKIVIPLEVNGLPVYGIAENAFKEKLNLAEVVFPSEEEALERFYSGEEFYIGEYAFCGCRSLKKIEIPICVTEIRWGAFQYCMSLEEVVLSNCYMENYVFYHCENLKKVTPTTCIGEGLFSHCKALEVFPVAEGTKEIGEDAFEHCYALTEIVIPKSVKWIGPLAFRNCHALKKATFEEPNGWFDKSGYTFKEVAMDLSNPEDNAKWLRTMDFDDGCDGWYRKEN